MNEKHSVNKNKFLKKTLFSFMLFLPICLASVASCYTFEYKIDYFSYQLVDYKKINHSNNYHPVIMNISKDNETNEYVSFNSLFSHFYYNMLCNGARIVSNNNFVVDDEYSIKMITQPTFAIQKKLNKGYYIDYGLFATYYQKEVLDSTPNTNVRGGADSFIFISDLLADQLLKKYGISSYEELILNPDYYLLNIKIDDKVTKKFCINNILYSTERDAPGIVDTYGDYFALFSVKDSFRDLINLSFDLVLKTNPYTNKKCFKAINEFGFSSNKYRFSFNCYDIEKSSYRGNNDSRSIEIGKIYSNLWENNELDPLMYLLYFSILLSFPLYYFFERRIFGDTKSQICFSLLIVLIISILFSILASLIYIFVFWGISVLFMLLSFLIAYGKEIFLGGKKRLFEQRFFKADI